MVDTTMTTEECPPLTEVPELNLREWSQQINLLSKIPEKAQKGFITLDLHLTCIGVIADYIALGTNVGLIYWYSRKRDSLERLKFEGNPTSPVSCISIVSCENYMIAAGNRDGQIVIFQIPKIAHDVSLPGLGDYQNRNSRKVQMYSVRDVHSGTVTALNWSANGMKLFSGDISGIVAETQVDFCSVRQRKTICKGISKSAKLLDESHEIVQLSYMNQNLLVSTIQRTILYSSKTKLVTKVGNQERKSSGRFGGVFAVGLWSKNLKLYAARPGLRLWLTDQEGAVQNTLIYKELVKTPHGTIPIINRVTLDAEERNLSYEKQFGFLYNFMGKYLVTWHHNILYVLDPVTVKVISSCSQLKSILSVDIYKDEIFVVETSRNVVRISVKPEEPIIPDTNNFLGLKDPIPGFRPDFKIPDQPFRLIASKLKETSRALPKFNSSSIITTVRNVLEADLNIQEGGYIPNVIPLRAPEVPDIFLESTLPLSPEVQELNSQDIEKFDKIGTDSFQEVLLTEFKPEKKRHKKRNGDVMSMSVSDSISMSSQGSTNSEALTDSPEKERTFTTTLTSSVSTSQLDQTYPPISERRVPDISSTDLRSKEEMLAKMLKWAELLPSFDKENSDRATNSGTEFQRVKPRPIQFIYSSDEEDEAAKTPSFGSCNGPKEIQHKDFPGEQTFHNTLNGSEICSSVDSDVRKLTNGTTTISNDNSDSIESALASGLEEYENFASIYDERESSNTISIASSQDFFGPPSGSSNVTLTEGNSGAYSTTTKVGNWPTLPEEALSMPSKLPVQDMTVSGVTLNDYWVNYELPSGVTSICTSDKFLICIDAQFAVYYSRINRAEHALCWIKTNFQAIQLTSTPDGSTIWKIDPTGTLSTLTSVPEKEPFMDHDTWEVICSKVKHAAIGSDIGFLIKTDNSLHVCRFPEEGRIPSFESFQAPAVLSSIHVLEDAVWGLGIDGRVFYRTGIGYSAENWYGDAWIELRLNIPPVVAMSLGPQGSVWLVDVNDQIRFFDDFISSRGKYKMWDVIISEDLRTTAIRPHTPTNPITQWTQKLTESFRWTRLPLDGPLPLLASCHSIVAFTIQSQTSIFVNLTCTSGHRWDPVTNYGGSIKNWKWTSVFAGSIYNEHGFLWLEEVKGKLFHLQGDKSVLQPLDTPCTNISRIATAPEAIWVLSAQGTIYARCNINAANELGSGWDKIELSPIPDDRKLVHISCGSEVAWSCDDKGSVYIRNGSLNPPCSTDISPAWITVEGSPNYSLQATFTKVYVGPSGRIVWALDSRGSVYAREAIFSDFPIGTSWVLIPSVEAASLAISESAVWALSIDGEIFRRCGISDTNFVGDCWKRIPGTAKALTVSICDEVWALDSNGTLLKHYVEELYHLSAHSTSRARVIQEDDEESTDWELLG